MAAVLAVGALFTGCGIAQPPADTLTDTPADTASSTPTVTTSARVAASTFPELAGYQWEEMPAAEWEQAWEVLSSDFGGVLASGLGRYALDTDGNLLAVVAVLTPTPENSSPAALKGIFDQQTNAVAENFGVAAVLEEPAHNVLHFTDRVGQPNFYWVSGDEFVVVVVHDEGKDHQQFYEALCACTL